jgi:hypothetical protein
MFERQCVFLSSPRCCTALNSKKKRISETHRQAEERRFAQIPVYTHARELGRLLQFVRLGYERVSILSPI